ncbi:Phage tail collar domain containing protein [uncultured Caudovirales phage]|uniref:Phage tail collar domain containing protein n=1 Tax=uncultured Caudovirales phage TaxID=2100421 RepID=A0A6J7WWV7_9CAUD|nr:Phage tail collar domain containing protein [uncultured Caudovirales phage]
MSELGDKSFAKEFVNSIETVVSQNIGNSADIDRYQAKVDSVDTTNHTASVRIGGSTDLSTGFKIRGMQFPSANDLVMVCISGDEKWIESVVRPVGTGAYPSITLDWTANQVDVAGNLDVTGALSVIGEITNYGTPILPMPAGVIQPYMGLTTNIPVGWLHADGSDISRTTYASLFSVLGTRFGSGNGSTTFTLPDMDGYTLVGTTSASPGTSNATGTTDGYLSTSYSHTHAVDPASTATSADAHTHTTNPASVTSATTSLLQTQLSLGGATSVGASGHTHSVDVGVTTSSSDSHSHTVDIASTTSAANTALTLKRMRVVYIIKY